MAESIWCSKLLSSSEALVLIPWFWTILWSIVSLWLSLFYQNTAAVRLWGFLFHDFTHLGDTQLVTGGRTHWWTTQLKVTSVLPAWDFAAWGSEEKMLSECTKWQSVVKNRLLQGGGYSSVNKCVFSSYKALCAGFHLQHHQNQTLHTLYSCAFILSSQNQNLPIQN